MPPRNTALPSERQPVTAAKISAALEALATARTMRSIVSVGYEVGLSRGSANKQISANGQCLQPDQVAALPDFPAHARKIEASLRQLGHVAQADWMGMKARTGDRHRASASRPARPGHFDAHKLVSALQYFKQREAARAAGRFDDETLLRSVDETVGVKSRLVSGWVTTGGELVKPVESIARLDGYLERREEIKELLLAFGHGPTAAALLDHVPMRRPPSAAALAQALDAIAKGGRGSMRAAELASGLSRTTMNSYLKGTDAALAGKIGSLPDYGMHAKAIHVSLLRMGRKSLVDALPPTASQRDEERKKSAPVPWSAHVFIERAGSNLHKIEAAARLIRAGVQMLDARKQVQIHEALILPFLDDRGALRAPSQTADMLGGMDLQAERRIRDLVSKLSRRLDPASTPSRLADTGIAGAVGASMPAHEFLDRASVTVVPIVAATRLLHENPKLSRGAAARSVGASPSVLRTLLNREGVLRHAQVVANLLSGMDQRAMERLQNLVHRLGERLGQTPALPVEDTEPMRSVTMKSGVFGVPRLLVVDQCTQVPKRNMIKGIYEQNTGLVQPPRSFEQDRQRQPLRWLSTVLKEAFDNSLEVQCYFDAKRRQIILSTNRTFLNKQIQEFVHSGKLAAMLAASPPRLAPLQPDRVERHFAKLVGRMDVAMNPHSGGASDAVLTAIADGRIQVADPDDRAEVRRMALHAERRILQHQEARFGESLQLSNLAGTMRPCGDCAEALGADPNVRRGPFFDSQAARMLTDSDQTRTRNERGGIGTFVTLTRDDPPRLTFAHDTDSDSDAGFSGASDSESVDVRGWLKQFTAGYKRRRAWRTRDGNKGKRIRLNSVETKPSNESDSLFDWGKHLRSVGGGEPPPGMAAPHAHHIVFKTGRGVRMCRYLDESKALLEKHGIDWLYGPENLVWAPMKNHSTGAARAVRDALVEADRTGSRDAVAEALARLGRHFADGTIGASGN